ncbi:hypothetical protein BCR43DRAFT_497447 [Syncephalastrum racemosum]|uniref:Uncharacterized protein n=1 Tax=Syncephalastrum racemosum TaxID=13706 RepID=A0A1X2H2B1_SYNRA|nr:hypothetical protein BCR43DRAFT_497447 [Syncephalastrum racemosum]
MSGLHGPRLFCVILSGCIRHTVGTNQTIFLMSGLSLSLDILMLFLIQNIVIHRHAIVSEKHSREWHPEAI